MMSGESRDNLIGNNLFDNIDADSRWRVRGAAGIRLLRGRDEQRVHAHLHWRYSRAAFSAAGSALDRRQHHDRDLGRHRPGPHSRANQRLDVSNNAIVGIGTNAGITMQGVEGSGSVVVAGNAIESMVYGILLIDNPTSAGVSIT